VSNHLKLLASSGGKRDTIPNFFLVDGLGFNDVMSQFSSIYKVDDENFILLTGATPTLGSYGTLRPAANFYRLTSSSSDGVPALSHIGCLDTTRAPQIFNQQNHINGFRDNALQLFYNDGAGSRFRTVNFWAQFDEDMKHVIGGHKQNSYSTSAGNSNKGKVFVDPNDASKKLIIDTYHFSSPGYGGIFEYYENDQFKWRRSIYHNGGGGGGTFDIISIDSILFRPSDIVFFYNDVATIVYRSNGSKSYESKWNGMRSVMSEWFRNGSYSYSLISGEIVRINGSSLSRLGIGPISSGANGSSSFRDNEVPGQHMAQDPEGNLWIVYENRIGKYNPSTDRFVGFYEISSTANNKATFRCISTSSDGVVAGGLAFAHPTSSTENVRRLLVKLAFDGSSTMSQTDIGGIGQDGSNHSVYESAGISITWTDVDQSNTWNTSSRSGLSGSTVTSTTADLKTAMENAGQTSFPLLFSNSKLLD
jgi:hypothetical protein